MLTRQEEVRISALAAIKGVIDVMKGRQESKRHHGAELEEWNHYARGGRIGTREYLIGQV